MTPTPPVVPAGTDETVSALSFYVRDWARIIYDVCGDQTKVDRAILLADLNGMFDPAKQAVLARAPQPGGDPLGMGTRGDPTTLLGMISAIYGGLDAEDCALVDREWTKWRGLSLSPPAAVREALDPDLAKTLTDNATYVQAIRSATIEECAKVCNRWIHSKNLHERLAADDIARDIRALRALSLPATGGGEAPPTKFSPGDPVEIRNQNDAIDEIIIRRGDVHIEQMSADSWFMGVDASDGSYWQFWFGAKNRKSHVEFRHTETVSAQEQAAMRARPKSGGEA